MQKCASDAPRLGGDSMTVKNISSFPMKVVERFKGDSPLARPLDGVGFKISSANDVMNWRKLGLI
jgi:hypothetical protein